MSPAGTDEREVPHPRATSELFGHTEAEQTLLDDAPVAPLYFTVSRNLVNPRITGWTGNLLDFHRARYLCMKSRTAG